MHLANTLPSATSANNTRQIGSRQRAVCRVLSIGHSTTIFNINKKNTRRPSGMAMPAPPHRHRPSAWVWPPPALRLGLRTVHNLCAACGLHAMPVCHRRAARLSRRSLLPPVCYHLLPVTVATATPLPHTDASWAVVPSVHMLKPRPGPPLPCRGYRRALIGPP